MEEIREYQIKQAQNVRLTDLKSEYKLIGIIKIKFDDEFAYSGVQIYDIKKKGISEIKFNRFKPIFMKYFPSVLFLNRTDIYLNSIKKLNYTPDCYIINSSGQIHPYLYGCACDFGLKVRIPVIGYTKKLLFGYLDVNEQSREIQGVYYQGTLIGYAISRPNSKKFFYISVGNRITLTSALKLFLNMDFKIFSRLNIELNIFIQSRKKHN